MSPSKFMISAVSIVAFPSLAGAATTSTFSLVELGAIGTQTGMITVPNADASGGQVTVTVSTNVQGGTNGLHVDQGVFSATVPPSPTSGTFGYIHGSGDASVSATGNDATTLTNFTSITLAFSEPVTLNSLLIRDIDQNNVTGTWIDTVWAELDTGAPTYDVGSGLEMLPWANTTAYRKSTSGNDGVGTLANQLDVSSASEINSVTIFVNNSAGTTANTSSHGVDLGTAISFTVVPEPSSALLLGLGLTFLARRRR